MDQENLRKWLKAAFEESDYSLRALAKALGIHPSTLSGYLGTRKGEPPTYITPELARRVASTLKVDLPGGLQLGSGPGLRGLPVSAQIADHIWSPADPTKRESGKRVHGRISERYPLEAQSAYEIAADVRPGEPYRRGDVVICVPYSDYRTRPQPDDKLVMRIRKGDLIALTLRRVVNRNGAIELWPMLVDSPEVDDGAEPFALVVAMHRDEAY